MKKRGIQENSDCTKWEIVAIQMMREILYDNGGVNRFNPEPNHWPVQHTRRIAKAAEIFFTAHPEFLNGEDIQSMCAGEEGENQARFGIHPEYAALEEALNKYFDP